VSAGGDVLLFAGSKRPASAGATAPVVRDFPGRRVQRLRQASMGQIADPARSCRPAAGATRGGRFSSSPISKRPLGRRKAAGKKPVVVSPIALEVVRRPLRYRTGYQRAAPQKAPRRTPGAEQADRRGAHSTPISRRSGSIPPGPMTSTRP
jgi:hypothetical protein